MHVVHVVTYTDLAAISHISYLLHDTLAHQGFFFNPGWEHEVLDSGWLAVE